MSKGFSLIISKPNRRSASSYDTLRKQLGTPSTTDPKAKNGNFLEKEFLSKEVSRRNVELDEVIVPSLELENTSPQKTIPMMPTPTREEANDVDHETSDQVTTGPRRSNRARSHQSGTVTLSWKSCY